MYCSRYDHQTGEEASTSGLSLIGRFAGFFCQPCSKSVVLLTIPAWFLLNLAFSGSNQAYRAISTSQLKALLLLHLWPIDVVVFHGPQGDLVLKGASRLDAFSGYPVRT